MKSKHIGFFIVLIAILAISVFYNYPNMLHLLPQGSHLWRQTYSMDMVLNYKLYHLPFFQPEVSNLMSINGKAAAEFPVFYFIAAQFSNSEYVLRLIHSIIFLSGIISTYYISFYFLRDKLLSFLSMGIIFTSPLLVFYGNNFLTDVPALSISYIAWASFLSAKQSKYPFALYCIFLILLSFSCLLKASQAINYGILFVLIFQNPSYFIKNKKISIVMLATLLPTLFWYWYAKEYNLNSHHTYFFLGISPFWKLSLYDIGLTAWRITVSWSKSYFWRPTSLLLILCFGLYWKFRNDISDELNIFVRMSFLCTVIYILLFYERLMKHEYYYITFYIFILFWIISILFICKKCYVEIINWIKVFLVCLLIINIVYCKYYIQEKMNDALYNKSLASDDMQFFLEKNGVSQDKSVLSIPDETPCQTLYLIKRKGYTEFNDYKIVLKNSKADYLILSNETWKQKAELKPYLNDSIGNFNGITLYKLK